jgi:hypothetical protein
MTAVIAFHEVEDGQRWANAFKAGRGSRHEMCASIGITVGTFHDPDNADSCGLLREVEDMDRFQEFMASEDAQKAMAEDGLKVETLRVLAEFTP